MRSLQPRYLIPAFGMAVLCVFIVFRWNYQSADVGMLMGESYKTVASSAAGVIFNEKIRFPWENPKNIYGFGSVSSLSQAANAFADGMKLGRDELAQITFRTYPQKDRNYFELGKWCVLLQAACLPEIESMPDDFWKNQKLILKKMQKEFRKSSDSEAETVRASLDKIGSLLKDSPDKRECQAIAKEADLLIRRVVR
ncbi:MAG: hypothetical protein HC887_01875 [Desulfobacteraceae bacterium]|nr:hypothetical protein [Desulfobacteraceae bacterium]